MIACTQTICLPTISVATERTPILQNSNQNRPSTSSCSLIHTNKLTGSMRPLTEAEYLTSPSPEPKPLAAPRQYTEWLGFSGEQFRWQNVRLQEDLGSANSELGSIQRQLERLNRDGSDIWMDSYSIKDQLRLLQSQLNDVERITSIADIYADQDIIKKLDEVNIINFNGDGRVGWVFRGSGCGRESSKREYPPFTRNRRPECSFPIPHNDQSSVTPCQNEEIQRVREKEWRIHIQPAEKQ